jgi:hypothetical protein
MRDLLFRRLLLAKCASSGIDCKGLLCDASLCAIRVHIARPHKDTVQTTAYDTAHVLCCGRATRKRLEGMCPSWNRTKSGNML